MPIIKFVVKLYNNTSTKPVHEIVNTDLDQAKFDFSAYKGACKSGRFTTFTKIELVKEVTGESDRVLESYTIGE